MPWQLNDSAHVFKHALSLAWSENGLTLASAGQDGTIRLWDNFGARLERMLGMRLHTPRCQLRTQKCQASIPGAHIILARHRFMARTEELRRIGMPNASHS